MPRMDEAPERNTHIYHPPTGESTPDAGPRGIWAIRANQISER
jgi:hypothetical protein